MKHSTVPEIAALANEELATDDYWNDTSDNIEVMSEQDIDSTTEDHSTSNDENKGEKLRLHLLPVVTESDKQSGISPNLTYDVFMFPKSVDFEKNNLTEKSNVFFEDKGANEKTPENDSEKRFAANENQPEESSPVLQR